MSASVGVLAVMDEMAGKIWRADDSDPILSLADESRAAVAAMIEALEGLDEAYCRAGPQLTRDERMEDRKRLIAARAALARVKGGAA